MGWARIHGQVYTSTVASTITLGGARFQLPLGTERKNERDWEEVILPVSKRAEPLAGETLVQISQFDEFARPGTCTVQSGGGCHC